MDDQTQIPDAPIEDAPKRRGRPPKSADVPDVAEPVADVEVTQSEPLTFEEVMAWNRANADKMPQPVSLPAKKRAKSKRM
jgi:hypothetical protein